MIKNIQSWTDDELWEEIRRMEEAMGWSVKGPWLAGTEYLRALNEERERRIDRALKGEL